MKTKSSCAWTAVSATFSIQKQKSSTITKQTKKKAKDFIEEKVTTKSNVHQHPFREANRARPFLSGYRYSHTKETSVHSAYAKKRGKKKRDSEILQSHQNDTEPK